MKKSILSSSVLNPIQASSYIDQVESLVSVRQQVSSPQTCNSSLTQVQSCDLSLPSLLQRVSRTTSVASFPADHSSRFSFLHCRVWSPRERENAPQHPSPLHRGSQHEGCQVRRLPRHRALRTTGRHLLRSGVSLDGFQPVLACAVTLMAPPLAPLPQSVTPCATPSARPAFRPPAAFLLSTPPTSPKLCAERRPTRPPCKSKRPAGTFAWRDG